MKIISGHWYIKTQELGILNIKYLRDERFCAASVSLNKNTPKFVDFCQDIFRVFCHALIALFILATVALVSSYILKLEFKSRQVYTAVKCDGKEKTLGL